MVIKMPDRLQPMNRLDVAVNSTTAPEIRVPAGVAAIDRAMVTEFTLPCMSNGTTICIKVCNRTLATGMLKANTNALRAMNQNCPVGVRATSAYPNNETTMPPSAVATFLLNSFLTDIMSPPARIPPCRKAMTRASSVTDPRWSNLTKYGSKVEKGVIRKFKLVAKKARVSRPLARLM